MVWTSHVMRAKRIQTEIMIEVAPDSFLTIVQLNNGGQSQANSIIMVAAIASDIRKCSSFYQFGLQVTQSTWLAKLSWAADISRGLCSQTFTNSSKKRVAGLATVVVLRSEWGAISEGVDVGFEVGSNKSGECAVRVRMVDKVVEKAETQETWVVSIPFRAKALTGLS
jgi:hypothetical protein